MNHVYFKVIKRHKYVSGHEVATVNIFVDEKPLAELMKAYEMPFAETEGHPNLAGDYHAIEIASSSLEQYYLGSKQVDGEDFENKTVMLGCSCGNIGCWPLLCKITIEGANVIWSEFEQPHREEDWDYSNFNDFVFDKRQYLNAIEAIKA